MKEFTNEILEEAENMNYKFQTGCYFSGTKKIQGTLLSWSDKIKDPDWNHATNIDVDEASVEELIEQIITFYKKKDRLPAIYFTPFTKPNNLNQTISKLGFKSSYKDVWMFYEKDEPKVTMPENFIIKPVETEEEMKTFVDIFHQAYGGATPEEPYGDLPKEYGESLFDSFTNPQKDKTTIHYLGILDKKPIGIATLIYSGNFGCFYNLGSIPNQRKKGIGKALTFNAISDSIKNNAKIVFLQTEQGSFNEKYFTGLSFSTKFVGEGFVKEIWNFSLT